MSHQNRKAQYTRKIERSNTIATTLFVLGLALLCVLTVLASGLFG